MKIQIVKHVRLIDGEQYHDSIETIETDKSVSFSLIRKYDLNGDCKNVGYIQIGCFLDKDFKDIEITDKDMIYIEGE